MVCDIGISVAGVFTSEGDCEVYGCASKSGIVMVSPRCAEVAVDPNRNVKTSLASHARRNSCSEKGKIQSHGHEFRSRVEKCEALSCSYLKAMS